MSHHCVQVTLSVGSAKHKLVTTVQACHLCRSMPAVTASWETGQDLSGPADDEVDVEAPVGAALAQVLAAASDPPPAAAGFEGDTEGHERRQQKNGTRSEEDDGIQITGVRVAHEARRGSTRVTDRGRPKAGQVEMCRHRAKAWCMRADTYRFAHAQPRVLQGVSRTCC